ncbi:MEDS domain-containing protein [Mycobacterium sp. 236(2023)]|uniref:MEDS domain-containing protein n=1 Tax=Mycobacterium sp. 236(2023) TaxID=3038163 RepID=UPI002414D1AE|nr:MEDS domain-containing protein [Mycobacterium sp. 236(2023)]MDG4667218.1 MEDS domain-containing protein [Mycobacterium sp. 236(2023)]
MSDALDLGVPGIAAALGDHICGLYSTLLQRDQILLPFLEAGLAAGDKCICVVDGSDPKEVLAALDSRVPAAKMAADKQLDVIRARDMYLRSGGFSADEVISTWKAAMSDVMYDGRFDAVRAVEAWSRRDVVPDMDELMVLENEMNRFLPLFPQVVVCLYDIDRFGGGIVVNLLKTHPRMLIGGMLVENPYCISPDEFLHRAERGSSETADAEITEAAKWYFDETTGSN